ncbi:hypothetical protein Hanom_Chr07g00666951 [Helianthus anomalus]
MPLFNTLFAEAKKRTPEKKGVVITDPQESVQKKTKITIKPFKIAGVESEKEKGKVGEKPFDNAAEKERGKEKTKEKTVEKPIGSDPKDTGTAATTASDKAQGPEVVRITRLDHPHHEKRKEPEVEKPTKTVPADAPVQTVQFC